MPGFLLSELTERLGGRLIGPDRRVRGILPLPQAGPEDLSFLTHPRYRDQVEGCRAAAILAPPGTQIEGVSLILVNQPYLALAKMMRLFHPPVRRPEGVSPKASLAADCQLGSQVSVGPFVSTEKGCYVGDGSVLMAGVVLGERVRIGKNVTLYPSVVVGDDCEIGDRSIVQAGTVIGSDGFGFAEEEGVHLKIPQVGNVVIEEDVELGANVTIDRATLGTTRIGRGTKIDNLVQIGHNSEIGQNCLLVAQVGIAGSVKVGNGVVFAGQSGSVGHISIGDHCRIGAKAAVTRSLRAGSFVIGHPARDHREWKRAQATLSRLSKSRSRTSPRGKRLSGGKSNEKGEEKE